MSLLGNGLVTLGSQIGVEFERERQTEMVLNALLPNANCST